MLHVLDHHLAHSDLHPRKLTEQGRRDNAASSGSIHAVRTTIRPAQEFAEAQGRPAVSGVIEHKLGQVGVPRQEGRD
jgi:hypothetical protein